MSRADSAPHSAPADFPPAPRYGHRSVADVLGSAAAVLDVPGFTNVLDLPTAQRVVVVLVDGLGLEQLQARMGYAPVLRSSPLITELDAAFPTTTASSLASLGTATPVGTHGLTGYDSYSPELGQAVNMLGNWDRRVDPHQWQPHPTVLERAHAAGVDAVTVSRKKFRDSPLTTAALRGGRFVGADTPQARVRAALENLSAGTRALMYFYWDDLDKTGHQRGWQSSQWSEEVEELDAALRRLAAGVPKNTLILLTADHGMVDIPREGRLDVSRIPGLLEGVQTSFGEPRCLQLRLDPGVHGEERSARQAEVVQRWTQEFGDQVHAATREQLLTGGWYGPPDDVRETVVQRIGDVVLLPARDNIAFHDIARIGKNTLEMVGQHGGLTRAESVVPLMGVKGFS
ncbi:alkaline phosphatase family protein [Kocuria sp.]|uniref:alkaline phosphatase family protein n=1 Tax=Kocuria sp. TaxID=1871328 RepID=UPI0026DFD96B|nr:alkaline phosphatase family protein [Kocuria sp.]MDO5619368.1 alkaline phosphatase family protein [Kocuria sp.]